MEFREMQTKTVRSLQRYGGANKIRIDDNYILLKLNEEVGELAQAALVYKDMCREEKRMPKEEAKKIIADQLADITAIIMTLASVMNVDIEKTIEEKWMKEHQGEEF